MRKINNESGMILPLVIIFALALTITGLAFLNMGVMEHNLAMREVHKNQAFWLAEAGVESTIWRLNYGDSSLSQWAKDDSNQDSYIGTAETLRNPQEKNVGDYKVKVEKDKDKLIVESTGYVPAWDAEKKVEKTVRVTLKRTPHWVFDYAIASDEEVKAENAPTEVKGDVYANGNIIVENATIDGDATATGNIIGEEYITGTCTHITRPIEFPEYSSEEYRSKASIIITHSELKHGRFEIEGKDNYSITGILYVEGNVTISNSLVVAIDEPGTIVAIVAEGIITVEMNSQVGTSPDDGVSLISAYEKTDDMAVKIEDNSEVYGALWAPYGRIWIETGSTLHGSAVSGLKHRIETLSGAYVQEQIKDGSLPSVYRQEHWQEL